MKCWTGWITNWSQDCREKYQQPQICTLLAENEEKIKNLLMKVKEESEKSNLKLSIQKMKITASGLISSVQFSHSVVSNSLWSYGLQHNRLTCPSPTTGAYSNSCPSHWWCHPMISSSVIPFSSCPPSFPVSGSFPMSQFFASGGQSLGASASASVPPMIIQDGFPLGLTHLISLQSNGLSRVLSNPTVQKHQFFGVQFSL